MDQKIGRKYHIMKKHKRIALITGTESTKLELLSQLKPLLQDYVDIVSYASDSGIKETIKTDLIVISSKLIIDEVMPFIDSECPVILARRALNTSRLDKLFSIPEGTMALLVNDTPETAIEVIELLKEIGIDHINLIPYYPGATEKCSVPLAITPGEASYAPSHIKNVIDIGPRIIDLTTIVEILEKLGLLDEKANFVSARYMETIMRLSKQLYLLINESNKLNDYLVKVMNQVNDGIMAFDKEGRITVFNQKCEEIFKLRHSYVIGNNLSHIIKDKSLTAFLAEGQENDNQLFKINGTEIIVCKLYVEKMDSIICTMKTTKEVADMEHKLRASLIKMGHIGKYRFTDIIGSSRLIKSTIETAKKLAKTDLSILIHGESGTGKELFASSIHNESSRCSGPFLAVNFSALPEELVETELFGYEEGAFTGAKKGGKIGLFEQTQNGTIFLDEIGDTSPKIQARLLRVLQEKEIMRVGGTEIIHVNVRVIAATNKDLIKMCQEGKFREDLYYRLKKLYLKTPPLRDRLEDINELTQHFLIKCNRPDMVLSDEVHKVLTSHSWPGNVRELESTIEYMVAVCEGRTITIDHIPQDFYRVGLYKASPMDSLLGSLSSRGNMEELVFILRSIHKHNRSGKSVGRKIISDEACRDLYCLTEEQIRKRTDLLTEMDLLVKPRGRGGMHLTIKGIDLVENYNK